MAADYTDVRDVKMDGLVIQAIVLICVKPYYKNKIDMFMETTKAKE